MSYTYYTKEGYERLKNELNDLKTRGRVEIARQIAEARDKGDLSENAEYDAAKDAQGLHELKISKLEQILSQARIIDESAIDTSKVSILSHVKVKFLTGGLKGTVKLFTIVAEEEADLKANKISIKSPYGTALLGKTLGEIAIVKAPAGELQLEILEISR